MIAITGASGLLGSSILTKLVSERLPVVGLRRTNCDPSQLVSFSKDVEWRDADVTNSLTLTDALKNIDTVIHTAAIVSFDPRAKERIFQTNVVGTQNVVNA